MSRVEQMVGGPSEMDFTKTKLEEPRSSGYFLTSMIIAKFDCDRNLIWGMSLGKILDWGFFSPQVGPSDLGNNSYRL